MKNKFINPDSKRIGVKKSLNAALYLSLFDRFINT